MDESLYVLQLFYYINLNIKILIIHVYSGNQTKKIEYYKQYHHTNKFPIKYKVPELFLMQTLESTPA